MQVSLGRLKALSVREVWKSEPRDFTAWLAEPENLELLGEALSLQLELVAREHSIGPFSADLVARDPNLNLTVVIENQLEPTDHRHLGQIITYAAGIEATILVWVAPEFRDEHRSAMDWLNRASLPGFDFFAVQIEAYQIGDSIPAPRFNLVAQPNSWTKRARPGLFSDGKGESTSSQQRWAHYWDGLKTAAGNRFPVLLDRATATGNIQRLQSVSRGSNLVFFFNLNATRNELRVELHIDGDLGKAAYRLLETQQDAVADALGLPLTWDPLPDARGARIYTAMPDAQGAAHAAPNAQYEWLIATGPKFMEAMRPFIVPIRADTLTNTERERIENGSS